MISRLLKHKKKKECNSRTEADMVGCGARGKGRYGRNLGAHGGYYLGSQGSLSKIVIGLYYDYSK